MVQPTDCIFCQIAHKQISAALRYEDDEMVAFDDMNPAAPIHILVIPKRHIASLNDAAETDTLLLGKLLYRAKMLAAELNIADPGYRVSVNVGKWGGQIVPHLHLHILGGAPLSTYLGVSADAATIGPKMRAPIAEKSA